jgi:hypothetical protein
MNKIFPVLLFAVSVLIAGTAAYFSVRGIGLLFAGSFLPVVVMASSLEIGKLFAVSFLYRKWKDIPITLKLYLSSAVVLLIAITSLGIFGFLSDAYQESKSKVSYLESKIQLIESQNQSIQQQISTQTNQQKSQESTTETSADRFKQIYDDYVMQQNKTMSLLIDKRQQMDDELNVLRESSGGLFNNKAKKIEQLTQQQTSDRTDIEQQIKQIKSNIQSEYNKFLSKIDTQVDNQQNTIDMDPLYEQIDNNNQHILSLKSDMKNTDIGSFKFIAESFGMQVDDAVKWFIIMIVVVFDPLAMCLIIGYNMYVIKTNRTQFITKSIIPTIHRK